VCPLFSELMMKWRSWGKVCWVFQQFLQQSRMVKFDMFMVIMPLDLWYAIRPFLHLVRMAKNSGGIISLWQIMHLIIWFSKRLTS